MGGAARTEFLVRWVDYGPEDDTRLLEWTNAGPTVKRPDALPTLVQEVVSVMAVSDDDDDNADNETNGSRMMQPATLINPGDVALLGSSVSYSGDLAVDLGEARRRQDRPALRQMVAERDRRLGMVAPEVALTGLDTCIICKEALLEECSSNRDPNAWGYTPCCGAYLHKRCLNCWIGPNDDRAVWAPTVDGRDDFTKEMEPACPQCRKPVTGRQIHLGRKAR